MQYYFLGFAYGFGLGFIVYLVARIFSRSINGMGELD